MGKQTNFFFAYDDEMLFINKVCEYDYIFMNSEAKLLLSEEIKKLDEISIFLTFGGSQILMDNNFIEPISSEVVQFTRCISWEKNTLRCGRIWAQFKYWNSLNEHVTKSIRFTQMYNNLAKWIKDFSKKSICGYYYIGPKAYNLYKEHRCQMVTGPKTFAEF